MAAETSARIDLVLFGGTGDLALRKLFPAMYFGFRDGVFANVNVIGAARQSLSTADYRAFLSREVREHIDAEDFDDAVWARLLSQVSYLTVDAGKTEDFAALRSHLVDDREACRVFYLATTPTLFLPICRHLAGAGLVTPGARVVLEKPLGRDLASSRTINDAVGAIFSERQIYRIDHYLGKEMVQNLLALRFGNTLLEPVWSRAYVRDVQITIAETVGVGSRGEFYDHTGALRDMVQNHLLQCLCIVAMEPRLRSTPMRCATPSCRSFVPCALSRPPTLPRSRCAASTAPARSKGRRCRVIWRNPASRATATPKRLSR